METIWTPLAGNRKGGSVETLTTDDYVEGDGTQDTGNHIVPRIWDILTA